MELSKLLAAKFLAEVLNEFRGHRKNRSIRPLVHSCFQSPSPWIAGILARLAETVGEPHEDAQSYVTDIMLFLHNTVTHLVPKAHVVRSQSPTHFRSTSFTPVFLGQTVTTAGSAAASSPRKRNGVH